MCDQVEAPLIDPQSRETSIWIHLDPKLRILAIAGVHPQIRTEFLTLPLSRYRCSEAERLSRSSMSFDDVLRCNVSILFEESPNLPEFLALAYYRHCEAPGKSPQITFAVRTKRHPATANAVMTILEQSFRTDY